MSGHIDGHAAGLLSPLAGERSGERGRAGGALLVLLAGIDRKSVV
jgi:hypothetical protein